MPWVFFSLEVPQPISEHFWLAVCQHPPQVRAFSAALWPRVIWATKDDRCFLQLTTRLFGIFGLNTVTRFFSFEGSWCSSNPNHQVDHRNLGSPLVSMTSGI